MPLPQEHHDRLIERLAVKLVALADVDPHQDALANEPVHHTLLQAINSLASITPSSAAPTVSTTLRPM